MYRGISQAQDKHNSGIIQARDRHKTKKFSSFHEAEDDEQLDRKNPTVSACKRITMAFADDLYDHLQSESALTGVPISGIIDASVTQMKPEAFDTYLNQLLIRPSKNFVPRRKGAAAKRITIRMSPEAHSKARAEAERCNLTLTQYVCLVIRMRMI